MAGREDGRAGRAEAGAKGTPKPDDGGARARPTGSGARQRRPSTARRERPARSGRGPARGAIGVHGLLGLSSTRRAAVLALVMCALVLSVAVPLRNYLAQRGALEDTVQQQDTLRQQVEELERRRAQLLDPAQVEVEARERLRYVKPGETPYVVQLPTSTPQSPPADAPRSAGGEQWYGQLWRSMTDEQEDG